MGGAGSMRLGPEGVRRNACKGNVATEKVAALAADLGFETGLDPDRLAEAAAFARSLRGPT